MAYRQSIQNSLLKEKPNSAKAVRATLKHVIFPVLSFEWSHSADKAEITVLAEMSMDTMPADATETPRPVYMIGQAAPSIESGNPKLMKEMYMIGNSNEVMQSSCLKVKAAIQLCL